MGAGLVLEKVKASTIGFTQSKQYFEKDLVDPIDHRYLAYFDMYILNNIFIIDLICDFTWN